MIPDTLTNLLKQAMSPQKQIHWVWWCFYSLVPTNDCVIQQIVALKKNNKNAKTQPKVQAGHTRGSCGMNEQSFPDFTRRNDQPKCTTHLPTAAPVLDVGRLVQSPIPNTFGYLVCWRVSLFRSNQPILSASGLPLITELGPIGGVT